jgi:hypothetical protein
MAYCRFGDASDVYVYADLTGYSIHALRPDGSGVNEHVTSALAALARLSALSALGVRVPPGAISRLQQDAEDDRQTRH